jgi:hypothetical protein
MESIGVEDRCCREDGITGMEDRGCREGRIIGTEDRGYRDETMGWHTDAAEKPLSTGRKIGLHGRENQWDGR